jgi:branched-chain amino acid transport system substrate-binding protein
MLNKAAITKLQAVIIAVIIIVACVAGGVYYYMVTLPPAPPAALTQIIVGWTEPDSGPLATLTPMYNIYYKWIIEDYNKTGGLYIPQYGYKIPFGKPIIYDDTGSISTMITEYEKLITVDKVNLLFAPLSTAMAYALFPICQQYKMPIIALTFGSDIAGANMKSGVYSYAFSVLGFPGESAEQMVEVFKYINSTVDPGGLRSVGILADSDQHGVEYGGAMDLGLVSANFTVPVYETFPAYSTTAAGFAPMIATLQASKPDAVIIAGYEGAAFEVECNALGYHPKLIVVGPGMETGAFLYPPWGPFTSSSQVNGTVFYDGWPATAYKTANLSAWAQTHYSRSATDPAYNFPKFTVSWLPYPASAVFYASLQCFFGAVQLVGLDGTAIRNALVTDTFNNTLVGQCKLRPGESMQCSLAGTITQWHSGNMSQVIWPLSAKSANIIYPAPQYTP